MPMSRVQFQSGLSMPEFLKRYGTDAQREAALRAARWPIPATGPTRWCWSTSPGRWRSGRNEAEVCSRIGHTRSRDTHNTARRRLGHDQRST